MAPNMRTYFQLLLTISISFFLTTLYSTQGRVYTPFLTVVQVEKYSRNDIINRIFSHNGEKDSNT